MLNDYHWYFITKDTGRVFCLNCSNSLIKLLQPIKKDNHEYGHSSSLVNISSSLKFDNYFYYDLIRLVLHSIHELIYESKWPMQLTFSSCNQIITSDQKKERSTLNLLHEISISGFYGLFGKYVIENVKHNQYIGFQEFSLKLTNIEFRSNQSSKSVIKSEWIAHPVSSRFFSYSSLQVRSTKNHYKIATVIVSKKVI